MPSEAEELATLAALNTKVNDQEARGLAMIAAKDTTIGELNDLVAQLQSRPDVPQSVADAVQTVADNLDDNFVAAQAVTAPK